MASQTAFYLHILRLHVEETTMTTIRPDGTSIPEGRPHQVDESSLTRVGRRTQMRHQRSVESAAVASRASAEPPQAVPTC